MQDAHSHLLVAANATRHPNNSGYDVGGSEFDDASPVQGSPLRPISFAEPLYILPTAGRGNCMIGSGAGRVPGGPRSAAEASSGVDELPWLFSSIHVGGGGASDVSRAPGAAATATATGDAGAYASRYTKGTGRYH